MYQCNRKGQNKTQICGGAIYNEEWLITAAHCLNKEVDFDHEMYSLTGVQLLFGDQIPNHKDECEETRKAQIDNESYFYQHKDYKNNCYKCNDVALIKIIPPLKFGWAIQKIQIAKIDYDISGKDLLIAGYGQTDELVKNAGDMFQKAYVREKDKNVCQEHYRQEPNAEDTWNRMNWDRVICASGVTDDKMIDACFGDSGGPLVAQPRTSNPFLVGIISLGPNKECAKKGLPGIYTDIRHYTKWIEDHVNGVDGASIFERNKWIQYILLALHKYNSIN